MNAGSHQSPEGLLETLKRIGSPREVKALGIIRVFCLTYVPEFFEKLGFSQLPKEELPHKIWTECINCHSFPDCGEIALIKAI